MARIEETVQAVANAATYDARIAEMRKIPGRHGTDELQEVYSQIARELYVPHLAPDFAYIHEVDYYDLPHFKEAYAVAAEGTKGFEQVDAATLAHCLQQTPLSLLALRTMLGLTGKELSHATGLVSEKKVSDTTIANMEQSGTTPKEIQTDTLARTVSKVVDGTLFGDPEGEVVTKQQFKPDTKHGWDSIRKFHNEGVPFATFLHQRHYGGAFRQLLDATSSKRGDLLEDAVESLFNENGIPYIRTGSHNQADIEARFELAVRPAPDFVVFDATTDTLMGMLECKVVNDGGTARDKALRFRKLKDESSRLNGLPVMAVLSGVGWHRTNDALGPVLEYTDGRVFTLATLEEMLALNPISRLKGTASS